MVRRGIVAGVTGVAMVVAGLAGCSSKASNPGANSSSAPKVILDGHQQNVTGQVSCAADGSNINIVVGDATNGVGVVVGNANPPVVHAVGLGTVNGVTLSYSDLAPQSGNAGAAQNGKSYSITGTANGIDMSTPQQPRQVSKSFEMDVTCP